MGHYSAIGKSELYPLTLRISMMHCYMREAKESYFVRSPLCKNSIFLKREHLLNRFYYKARVVMLYYSKEHHFHYGLCEIVSPLPSFWNCAVLSMCNCTRNPVIRHAETWRMWEKKSEAVITPALLHNLKHDLYFEITQALRSLIVLFVHSRSQDSPTTTHIRF